MPPDDHADPLTLHDTGLGAERILAAIEVLARKYARCATRSPTSSDRRADSRPPIATRCKRCSRSLTMSLATVPLPLPNLSSLPVYRAVMRCAMRSSTPVGRTGSDHLLSARTASTSTAS